MRFSFGLLDESGVPLSLSECGEGKYLTENGFALFSSISAFNPWYFSIISDSLCFGVNWATISFISSLFLINFFINSSSFSSHSLLGLESDDEDDAALANGPIAGGRGMLTIIDSSSFLIFIISFVNLPDSKSFGLKSFSQCSRTTDGVFPWKYLLTMFQSLP